MTVYNTTFPMPQLFVIIVIHFHCKLFRGLKSTLMHNLSELMISCLFERALSWVK